jgi:putative transcriptional regulator
MNLQNNFLIPTPKHIDSIFSDALIYICDHNENGALGLIVNHPIKISVAKILEQSEITLGTCDLSNTPVYLGGPVQLERGFVLHSAGTQWNSTQTLTETLALTTSRDILNAINEGTGPKNSLIILGYAGWTAGQLEQEITDHSWLNMPADSKILFDFPPSERLYAAVRQLGIEWYRISPAVGHA